jgi:hypothetical protein
MLLLCDFHGTPNAHNIVYLSGSATPALVMVTTPPKVGEELIRMSSEHWMKYVRPLFVYFLLCGMSLLLFVLAGVTAYHQIWISYATFLAALLVFMFAHHWLFVLVLGESMSHILVTNHRLIRIHESLFRDGEILEVSFDKMKTVEAKTHGLLQSLLRYGTLKFESGAKLSYVPHPGSVARDIEQAMGRL